MLIGIRRQFSPVISARVFIIPLPFLFPPGDDISDLEVFTLGEPSEVVIEPAVFRNAGLEDK